MPDYNQTATPELDVVRIVSLHDNAVLLVQESDDINWKLPGGKIHEGETIFQAFQRETLEELGITLSEADIVRYVAAPIPHSENIRNIFLVSYIDPKNIQKTAEVAEAKYFPVSKLPETKFKEHIASAVDLVK